MCAVSSTVSPVSLLKRTPGIPSWNTCERSTIIFYDLGDVSPRSAAPDGRRASSFVDPCYTGALLTPSCRLTAKLTGPPPPSSRERRPVPPGPVERVVRRHCAQSLQRSANSEEARGIATEKQGACLRIEAQLIDARQALANG